MLDEAHTYIGSQAAEITLLLRRVMHAFDVDPASIRFVATSATIGDRDSNGELSDFLADVSGAPRERVHVVTGERFVPDLGLHQSVDSSSVVKEMPQTGSYEELCSYAPARKLREELASGPAKLSDLCQSTELNDIDTLALLDKACTASEEGNVFLPLRLHLFHRTQGRIVGMCQWRMLGAFEC